jgi:trafficking protein particle complex subunit 13
MLSRRIPIPAPLQRPASALPPHLKRTPTPSSPSRPHSPQSTQNRPGTPPSIHRPGSPLRTRSQAGVVRPQSPAMPAPIPRAISNQIMAPILIAPSDVRVDLTVRDVPRDSIAIEKSFVISFTLVVSAFAPSSRPTAPKQCRIISLAVQHVQSPQSVGPFPKLALIPDALSPRVLHSGFTSNPLISDILRDDLNYATTHQKVLVASPQQDSQDVDLTGVGSDSPLLPPPFVLEARESSSTGTPEVVFLGPSAVFLDQIRLPEKDPSQFGADVEDDPSTESNSGNMAKVQVTRDFELSYLPLKKGFLTVGGLRVLLLEDKIVEDGEAPSGEAGEKSQRTGRQLEAKILEEWGVIGEIWVKS